MKNKAFALLLLAMLNTHALAETLEQKVGRAIMFNSKKYNIDPKIFYTIASTESDFSPYALCVETNKKSATMLKRLASKNIRVFIGKTYHSGLTMASIFPDNKEDAVTMAKTLYALGFTFDVGIMQINTCNFKIDEVDKMLDVSYSVSKGAKIYASCDKSFKPFKHKIECYNRGAKNLRKALKKNTNYFPYYERFMKKWDF